MQHWGSAWGSRSISSCNSSDISNLQCRRDTGDINHQHSTYYTYARIYLICVYIYIYGDYAKFANTEIGNVEICRDVVANEQMCSNNRVATKEISATKKCSRFFFSSPYRELYCRVLWVSTCYKWIIIIISIRYSYNVFTITVELVRDKWPQVTHHDWSWSRGPGDVTGVKRSDYGESSPASMSWSESRVRLVEPPSELRPRMISSWTSCWTWTQDHSGSWVVWLRNSNWQFCHEVICWPSITVLLAARNWGSF